MADETIINLASAKNHVRTQISLKESLGSELNCKTIDQLLRNEFRVNANHIPIPNVFLSVATGV